MKPSSRRSSAITRCGSCATARPDFPDSSASACQSGASQVASSTVLDPQPRRRHGLLMTALAATALIVYVPRTYRTLAVVGDSAELVTAAALWGVPHPPGYPLYTLLSHLFARVPIL